MKRRGGGGGRKVGERSTYVGRNGGRRFWFDSVDL